MPDFYSGAAGLPGASLRDFLSGALMKARAQVAAIPMSQECIGTTEWIWISQLLFCCIQKTLQEPLGSFGSFPVFHDPYDHPQFPCCP